MVYDYMDNSNNERELKILRTLRFLKRGYSSLIDDECPDEIISRAASGFRDLNYFFSPNENSTGNNQDNFDERDKALSFHKKNLTILYRRALELRDGNIERHKRTIMKMQYLTDKVITGKYTRELSSLLLGCNNIIYNTLIEDLRLNALELRSSLIDKTSDLTWREYKSRVAPQEKENLMKDYKTKLDKLKKS